MMVASPVGRVEHGNILVGEVEPSVKSCQQCRQHLYRLACGTHESLFLYVAKVGDCISCGLHNCDGAAVCILNNISTVFFY